MPLEGENGSSFVPIKRMEAYVVDIQFLIRAMMPRKTKVDKYHFDEAPFKPVIGFF